MLKVKIITAYFGSFPDYFHLWLKSCEENKDINFLIVTDQKINYDIPINVEVFYIKFENLRNLIKEKIKSDIILEKPYKLCDFKATYGIIFNDFLNGFDYWGHCDIDLIFGNIRKFLNEYHLENYDKFLKFGHLSLYKNDKEVNERFKLSSNWKNVLTTSENLGFDEKNGIYEIYKENNFPIFEKCLFADISKIYKRFRLAFKEKNYNYQIFYKKNNGIYRKYWIDGKFGEQEFLYIHFSKRKFPKETFDYKKIDSYLITNLGFFELKDSNDISIQDIKKFNTYKGYIYEKLEYFFYKLKRVQRRIKIFFKRN